MRERELRERWLDQYFIDLRATRRDPLRKTRLAIFYVLLAFDWRRKGKREREGEGGMRQERAIKDRRKIRLQRNFFLLFFWRERRKERGRSEGERENEGGKRREKEKTRDQVWPRFQPKEEEREKRRRVVPKGLR